MNRLLWVIICETQRAIGLKRGHHPHCPHWRGWMTLQDSEHVHIYPARDNIVHETGDNCPCGPHIEAIFRDDGSNGWLVTHHSLDGRETKE